MTDSVRKIGMSSLGLFVAKASPPIGTIKYRPGDLRPWIKTSTFGYSLLNSSEGKAADIAERGIVMTGGGSLLKAFPKLISGETRVPVTPVQGMFDHVALGLRKYLE